MLAKVFLSWSRFLLYKKWTPSIFTVSLLRLTNFMPQSATWTPFGTTIPAILHFVLLGYSPENFEKVFNSLINSIIEFLSLRKKIVSSAWAVYKNWYLTIFKPLTLGLFLINIKNISKTSINKCAEIGSPFEHLFLNWNILLFIHR